jgi:glycosyltransferase involved in cell wall biosynthesis
VPEPDTSICIPAYKADKYLYEALESVRSQTFTDWELIVTEDGSRDGTEEIVREFAESMPQPVRYQRHLYNRGLPAARNTGLSAARGEWIALLDADDIWHPQHLEALFTVATNSGADLAFSGCRIFDSETSAKLGTREACAESLSEIGPSLYRGDLVIQPSTVLFRESVPRKIGPFDECFPICNDLEFWIRAIREGCQFAYTGGITCDYRKHSTAMSGQSAALAEEAGRVYWKHRHWNEITRQLRRSSISRQFMSAARMYARRRPFHALRLCAKNAVASILV